MNKINDLATQSNKLSGNNKSGVNMIVPLKKIRTGRKFRFNGVLFKVIDKRAFGIVVAKNLENPEPYRDPKFNKETPVEPVD